MKTRDEEINDMAVDIVNYVMDGTKKGKSDFEMKLYVIRGIRALLYPQGAIFGDMSPGHGIVFDTGPLLRLDIDGKPL